MVTITPIRTKLISPLTSNTSNSFITLSSTDYNASYPAYKAFNGTNANEADCWLSSSIDPRYLQVGFGDFVYLDGLIFTSRNTSTPANVLNSDYDVFASNDNISWKKIITFGSPTQSNTDKQIIFPKVRCKYIKLVPIFTGSVAIGELNFYSVEEFYAIKQNGRYYSFNPAQYDSTTKMFKEITVDNIKMGETTEGILAEKYCLTSPMTDGVETFRAIDKFDDSFQIVSIKNSNTSVNGIKSTRQMVLAKSDFSIRLAEHIDNFTPLYTLTDKCSIKMVVSIDGGKTYLTTTDLGVTWSTVIDTTTVVLSTIGDINWSFAREAIYDHGFNISDLSNINFNTLSTNIQTMRFAYVLDIDSVAGQAVNTSLQWQFDARGVMKKMSDSEIDIEQNQYEITVTPKADMGLLKVNVGTGGTITINNITDAPVTEATNEDIINSVSEVWSE